MYGPLFLLGTYMESSYMQRLTGTRAYVTFAASMLLAACGSGGTGSSSGTPTSPTPPTPPPPDLGTAEGLWSGTTSTNRSIAGLVLDNGSYWLIYSAAGNNAVIGGLIQGMSTSTDGNVTSSNGIDFNFEGQGVTEASLTGTYTAKSKFGATLTYSGGATTVPNSTFTTTYDSDYDVVPSLATIAGTYSGFSDTAGGVESTTVTISGSGAITGIGAGGCSFSGTAAVHAKGAVYDVSVMFGGGVCSNGTNTVTGVAYFNAAAKQIIGVALNNDRTNGFLFEGTKP
jgi:hypothetical protein